MGKIPVLISPELYRSPLFRAPYNIWDRIWEINFIRVLGYLTMMGIGLSLVIIGLKSAYYKRRKSMTEFEDSCRQSLKMNFIT